MNQSQQGKAKMHVGVQGIGTSKPELEFLVRHGVTHMDASVENTEAETLVPTQGRGCLRRCKP